MVDNQQQSSQWGVSYLPYLEPSPDAGEGLLSALSEQACVVVTDEFPCFFLPHMVETVGKQLSVRLETVDSNGLVPLRATEKAYGRAFDFRRWLQGNLLNHLGDEPAAEPLADYDLGLAPIPAKLSQRWPTIAPADIEANPVQLQEFPIDHSVLPSFIQGGSKAGQQQLHWFLKHALSRYGEERSHPDADAASGLSPYLHFGHISVHEILHAVLQREAWRPSSIHPKVTGSSEGWWGTSRAVESFLMN